MFCPCYSTFLNFCKLSVWITCFEKHSLLKTKLCQGKRKTRMHQRAGERIKFQFQNKLNTNCFKLGSDMHKSLHEKIYTNWMQSSFSTTKSVWNDTYIQTVYTVTSSHTTACTETQTCIANTHLSYVDQWLCDLMYISKLWVIYHVLIKMYLPECL